MVGMKVNKKKLNTGMKKLIHQILILSLGRMTLSLQVLWTLFMQP